MNKKAVFLLVLLLVAAVPLIPNVKAYSIRETVFASGMDLLFIDSFNRYVGAESPYRQMLLDVSPYENHGYVYPNDEDNTIYSGPRLGWGKFGKAMEFDGADDFVNVTDHSSLDITDEVTVMAWVNHQNDTFKSWETILAKGDDSYRLHFNGGNFTFSVTNSTGSHYDLTSDVSAVTGSWYHVAGTYEDGTIRLYVSGELEANATFNGAIKTNSADLFLAANSGQANREFQGIIDEVRIYPFALTEEEILNDMISPIAEFRKYTFTASRIREAGGSWTWSEGYVSGRTGVNDNDIDLPWADAGTNQGATTYITKFLPSFQAFRSYGTLLQSGTYQNNAYVLWRVSFFDEGEIQADYYVQVRPNNTASSRTWRASFARTLPASSDTWKTATWTYNSYTAEHYAPLVTDIWVGPDNKHVSMRLVAENETTDSTYSWTYSFDLVDRSGNILPLEVFDGWVRLEYQVSAWAAADSKIEIYRHKGIWETIVNGWNWIVSSVTGAGATVSATIEPIIKPISEAFEPVIQQISDATDPVGAMIQNAIGALEHGIFGALSGVGKTISDAFAPVTSAWFNMVEGLQKAIAQAPLSFWNIFVDFMDTIAAWTGTPNLFSLMISWYTSFWNWVLSSITWLIDLFTAIFLFFAESMAKLVSLFGQVVAQWTKMVIEVKYFLDTGYGAATGLWEQLGMTNWLILAAVCYPLFLLILWDEQGFDAMLNHIKFMIDVVYMIIHVFIVIVQNVLAFIDYVIEAIPVVE